MTGTSTSPAPSATTLMLVLPVPLFGSAGAMRIDAQALNGLRRWLDNFDRIILCLPEYAAEGAPSDTVAFDPGGFGGRLELVPLPNARHPARFFPVLRATIARLDPLIDRSTHLSFAIGGLFGDWGAVAALRASAKRRIASVWTDRVESEAMRFVARNQTGAKRMYNFAQAFAMKHLERMVVRKTAVGLFHGASCYAAFAPFSPDPHLVHDIHLSEAARIPHDLLRAKITRAATDTTLVIAYAGRPHPDKGVSDWIDALRLLDRRGIDFAATWYGDGPLLETARAATIDAGLAEKVAFPGALTDRDALLARLRQAHVFLFCHKTPESPRCLIEALLSGTPIVGYDCEYPRDLISAHGGGVMTPQNPAALADAIAALATDRARLAQLIAAAAADGHPFTDTAVFHHRSELIKAAVAAS